MGLIKESVSELEKKVKYARIAMRFLKELKLVKYFMTFVNIILNWLKYKYFTL